MIIERLLTEEIGNKMDLEKFIEKTPYLYHLTSQVNAHNIIYGRKLISANQLLERSGNAELLNVQRQKRKEHLSFEVDGVEVSLRDQQPISLVALPKCLTDGWNVGDFLYHLNERVFMWPNLKRLYAHYNRYQSENPVIFRFSTKDIIEANPHVKFCRLNSGATRANSYLGGKAPERGSKSFLPSEEFEFGISNVAEVTFEHECTIAGEIFTSDKPEGVYSKVN